MSYDSIANQKLAEGVLVRVRDSGDAHFRNCLQGMLSASRGPRLFEEARDLVLDQLDMEREKNDQLIRELQEDLESLRFQVEILDAEIAESAIQREELHDAIDNAGSIDDIDRVLKGGIPGKTGGRRRR